MNTTEFKKRLEEEKTRLEGELASIGRRNPSNPADWEALPEETGQEADPSDTAIEIDSYERNTAVLKELETRYNEVLAALARITEGTYGLCAVGGEPIEPARLDADPTARTCTAHRNQ